ncbi:MAG: hypothetical protein ACRDLK_11715, partial [Gaiellaceae bacterium]
DEDPTYRDLLPPGTEEIVVRNFLVDAPPGWEPTLNDEHDGYVWLAQADAAERLYWPEPALILRSLR